MYLILINRQFVVKVKKKSVKDLMDEYLQPNAFSTKSNKLTKLEASNLFTNYMRRTYVKTALKLNNDFIGVEKEFSIHSKSFD